MFMEVFIKKKLAKSNKNVTQIPICLAFYCAPHSQGKYTCDRGGSLHTNAL